MKLKAQSITKKINNKIILDNISLTFYSGKIYGIWGRNGSGKTMLFRALSGLMGIDSGEILLDGKLLKKDFDVLPNLGITLEHAQLYPGMTGIENLRYLASINNKIDNDILAETIKRVGLNPNDKRTYNKYSLGMKQRLAIAQAIMESPDIIMLDEPTNGIDENGLVVIRNIILEEKKRGALILLASHNKDDISLLSDEVIELANGRVIAGDNNEKD